MSLTASLDCDKLEESVPVEESTTANFNDDVIVASSNTHIEFQVNNMLML